MRKCGLNIRNLSTLCEVKITWDFHKFPALGLKFRKNSGNSDI